MCGIVGYIGQKNAVPILIGGLEKLEYRGYDSAGVASLGKGRFDVYRSEGKLSKLKDILSKNGNGNGQVNGSLSVGIGHTRWATHGRPSEINAHPHVAGDVCVVHNGIIENYVDLREKLIAKGCEIVSETDSEIAAQLINSHLAGSASLAEAVQKACKELQGSYALVVASLKDPEVLVIARQASPIIIGVGEGEHFVASDIPAVLEHTRKIIIIEDGDIAEVRAGGLKIQSDGKDISRDPMTVTWDAATAQKDGYPHFMLKEIYEQPQAITDTFRARIDHTHGRIIMDDVPFTDKDFQGVERVSMVACGTAWHAALIGKFYIEKLAKLPVEVDYGSEFRYRQAPIDNKTLFIAVSQSGETADTLGSLQLAKAAGAKTLAITNVVGCSISRLADGVFYTHAGPEISVASTKAFVTQLTALFLTAIRVANARGQVSEQELADCVQDLFQVPNFINSALSYDKRIEKIAKKYGHSKNFLFLGRGFLYPVALEGALKLKEITYKHAEGYPAGEMKHGPIAMIDSETPVVIAIGRDGVNYEKTLSNIKEVESRGGRIIVVTDVATPELKELAWELIEVGEVPSSMLPLALTVPLQLLAYHVATYLGTDVDQPRNLAKSVTVE